jgi:signal transduction histidine kinase/ActR/RegA family two-component response regulator
MEPVRQKTVRRDRRVLVLAPTGRDGRLAAEVMSAHGFSAQRCADAAELCAEAHHGAGALLLAGEALNPEGRRQVIDFLRTQPFWSELPVIVLARRGEDLAALHAAFDSQCNMTFLERPVQIGTLLSAIRAALRARQRQYEVRDLVEQLRDNDRRKDEFLAMLGHELRNPLGVIRTALELLRNADGASAPRQVTRIEHQIAHLSRMVDDLLDVSRVSRGRITLQKQPCDLGALAAAAVDATAVSRGRVVELVRPEEPVWVDGDPLRLEQVINNLLGNAVKYTPVDKSIQIRVEADSSSAVLTVKDDGIGIHPDQLENIFDTFTQLSTSLARSAGGLGLGLALVRQLVRLHGGQVGASSDGPGKGSEFCVRLPLLTPERVPGTRPEATPGDGDRVSAVEAPRPTFVEAHEAAARHFPRDEATDDDGNGVTANAVVAAPAAPSRSVLVVEDLQDAREALGELLDIHGYQVTLAEDGPAGVEKALAAPPDVALVDIGLPGIDGYQVAQRLRERFGQAIYLIAMTGYGQAEDRRRAREAGFDEHLVKPVSPARLLALLSEPRPPAGVTGTLPPRAGTSRG